MIVVPMRWRDIEPGMTVCGRDGRPVSIEARTEGEPGRILVYARFGGVRPEWIEVKPDNYVPACIPTFNEAVAELSKHFTLTFLEW